MPFLVIKIFQTFSSTFSDNLKELKKEKAALKPHRAAVALNVCIVPKQCIYVLRVTFTINMNGLVFIVLIHSFIRGRI
jgi:hypothetical protein